MEAGGRGGSLPVASSRGQEDTCLAGICSPVRAPRMALIWASWPGSSEQPLGGTHGTAGDGGHESPGLLAVVRGPHEHS